MNDHHAKPARRQRGVTLIELMIGMAIGLLAVLLMTSVSMTYEGHKRTATAGSDAQVSSALALHALQTDLQMAGYGLASGGLSALGCPIKARRSGVDYSWSLTPVLITDGANGAPDTIDVLMSTNSQFSLPLRVAEDHGQNQNYFVLESQTNIGNAVGDLMVAVNSSPNATNWCSVFNVTDTSGNTIRHDPGDLGPWNQDPTTTVFPYTNGAGLSYPAGSYLVNLGRLASRSYSVNANQALTVSSFVTDTAATTNEELFPGLVNLQAVYGKDTDADRAADSWNATPPATAAEWAQIVAVRVAVVTRSTQYERDAVTPKQPTWKPDGITAQTIKVDGIADWKHYRYKVYEVVVPLRNVIWQS
jgi:type IV pilus assembly protein PilW